MHNRMRKKQNKLEKEFIGIELVGNIMVLIEEALLSKCTFYVLERVYPTGRPDVWYFQTLLQFSIIYEESDIIAINFNAKVDNLSLQAITLLQGHRRLVVLTCFKMNNND